ncbi:MAG TPA: type II secretion system F family protein [Nitrospirales bacterium]|nr:type II secretion system F family protein [Nitrospirales bacterium]HIN33552.1 type II secretion system F family protein [Nitrospirales bacterium]
MVTFTYTGKTARGQSTKGEISANSQAEAVAQLRKRRILGASVKEKKKKAKGPAPTGKDLVIFTRQFAVMINAGLPLVQALEILGSQCENKQLGQIIITIKDDVEGGSTFTDALKKHPDIFDELYVNLVLAGEAGGILDTILGRLSGFMEKAMKLKAKLKGAMTYPAIIVVVAVVVISVLMVWVIPVFAKTFEDLGGELPGLTKMVMGISEFMQASWYWGIVAYIVFSQTMKFLYKRKNSRRVMDRVFLSLPLAGPLIQKAAVAKFTRTLGTLLQSGVMILDGLIIVSKTSGNLIIEEAIMRARTSIAEGRTISEPLSEEGVFPPMVIHMIAVGESTGAVDAMMMKIADFYDDEVDTAVDAITASLEPMLMMVLGVVIGTIVIAMYLPIFGMADAIG